MHDSGLYFMRYTSESKFDLLLSCIFSRDLRKGNCPVMRNLFEDKSFENEDIDSCGMILPRYKWFTIMIAMILSNRNEVNRREGSSNYGRVLISKDSQIKFAEKYMGAARLNEDPYLSFLRIQDGEDLLGFSIISIVEKITKKNRMDSILTWSSSKNGDETSAKIYSELLEAFNMSSVKLGIKIDLDLFNNVVEGIMPGDTIVKIMPYDMNAGRIKTLLGIPIDAAKVVQKYVEGAANNPKFTDINYPNYQYPHLDNGSIRGVDKNICFDLSSVGKKRKRLSGVSPEEALTTFDNFGRILHSREISDDGLYGLLCFDANEKYPIIGKNHQVIKSMSNDYLKHASTRHSYVKDKYGNLETNIEHFLPRAVCQANGIYPHNPAWMMIMSNYDHRRYSPTAKCEEKCDILLASEILSKDELKEFLDTFFLEVSRETENIRCGKRLYKEISGPLKKYS